MLLPFFVDHGTIEFAMNRPAVLCRVQARNPAYEMTKVKLKSFCFEEEHTQCQENNSKTKQDTNGRKNLFNWFIADQNILQTLHTPICRENFGNVLHHFWEKLDREPST